MTTKQQAKLTYDKFSYLEGNQHIAGQFAIETILNIIQKFKVQNILEVGLGIGSISDAVLHYQNKNNLKINYVGTEANQFCLDALKTNVSDYERLKIYSNINEIENGHKFDLVIIDGSDNSLPKLKELVKDNTIVFIEGGRFEQVKKLKEIFPSLLYSQVISDYKNSKEGPFSKEKWSCGGSIFVLYPTFNTRLFWLFHKFRTPFVRRKRRFIK